MRWPKIQAEGPRKGAIRAEPDRMTYRVPISTTLGRTARCSGADCRAEILWVLTPAGKNAPLTYSTRVAVGEFFEMDAHHATCPNVGDFRRGRKAT